MSFEVNINRPVFTLYTGLTASGYDLVPEKAEDPIVDLIRHIRSHDWPKEAVSYFMKARLEGQGMNPYWPRAAMLLNATFYLKRGQGGANVDGYDDEAKALEDIARFPTDPSNKGEDTVSWVMDYPVMYNLIEEDETFQKVWEQYRAYWTPERRQPFESAARDAVDYLCSGLEARADDIPRFVVVPNPLQAPQIADFVRKDGVLFAVVATPRPSSIAHELLHTIFEAAVTLERAAIASRLHLFTPDMFRTMKKMQYAWDEREESWLRVFEESLVRAASIWAAHKTNCQDADRAAEFESREGFTYVPAILQAFRENWTGSSHARSFIAACLEAMEKARHSL